jgi:3-phosphoglycerate kinase
MTNEQQQVVKASEIPDGWMGLDNGPDATKEIQVKKSRTMYNM